MKLSEVKEDLQRTGRQTPQNYFPSGRIAHERARFVSIVGQLASDGLSQLSKLSYSILHTLIYHISKWKCFQLVVHNINNNHCRR